jgi:hypothetical protein
LDKSSRITSASSSHSHSSRASMTITVKVTARSWSTESNGYNISLSNYSWSIFREIAGSSSIAF